MNGYITRVFQSKLSFLSLDFSSDVWGVIQSGHCGRAEGKSILNLELYENSNILTAWFCLQSGENNNLLTTILGDEWRSDVKSGKEKFNFNFKEDKGNSRDTSFSAVFRLISFQVQPQS